MPITNTAPPLSTIDEVGIMPDGSVDGAPVIFAYAIDGKGAGQPLVGDDVGRLLADDRLAWAHLDANHPQTNALLTRELSYLDPFVVQALLAEETRPRLAPIGDGLLLILRGVNLNENADPEDMVSIRIFVDPHRIISVCKRKLKAVEDLQNFVAAGTGPKNSGDFVCMLMGLLFARMTPAVSSLTEAMDVIEETILDGAAAADRETVLAVRKKAIVFRRYMAPQRDLVVQLQELKMAWIDKVDQRHLVEVHDSITRVIEELDAVRERAQIINDEVTNQLTERLNKNMYALSVIAAIFLPLGFLTGLLGINIGGIPGAENPSAFMIFCGLLAMVVALQMIIFRKLRWF
jgi:zinc transporter